jgi:hypothetical protein
MPSDRSPEADVTLFSGSPQPFAVASFCGASAGRLGLIRAARVSLDYLTFEHADFRPLVFFSYLYLFLQVTTEAA